MKSTDFGGLQLFSGCPQKRQLSDIRVILSQRHFMSHASCKPVPIAAFNLVSLMPNQVVNGL
jgi:hypothetical protein